MLACGCDGRKNQSNRQGKDERALHSHRNNTVAGELWRTSVDVPIGSSAPTSQGKRPFLGMPEEGLEPPTRGL
jgi:hypothetical protein